MAKLNLNFHEQTGRRNPTKDEIVQIESVAVSVEAIIKTLAAYTEHTRDEDIGCVCVSVCNVLEMLIDPVIGYLSEYAGNVPAEGKTA
jgi:hypothetical protein